MSSPRPPDYVVVLVAGLLVILAPALILAVTVGFLVLTGDLVLGRITLLEFLELYLVDLVLVVGIAYGTYRLTLWLVEHRLPESLDALESPDSDETENSSGDHE